MAQSKLKTELRPDAPVVLNAGYSMTAVDRQTIDGQIRAVQEHLSESFLNGLTASFYKLSLSSPALLPGDCFCADSVAVIGIERIVTKAVAGTLASAGKALGVALTAATPGTKFRGATGGLLERSITGIPPGSPGPVRVNGTTARCERVGQISMGDHIIGSSDAAGNLSISAERTAGLTNLGDLGVGGHINTSSDVAPEIAPNLSGLGALGEAEIEGSDASGQVTLTRGTGGTVGLQATITLGRAYLTKPRFQLLPLNEHAARSDARYYARPIDAQTIGIYAGNVPESSQVHEFSYQIMGSGTPASGSAIILFNDVSATAGFFGTAFEIARPANYLAGDFFIARIVIAPGANADAFTVTPPAGWTLRMRTEFADNGMCQLLFTNIATVSEPASYTFTMGASVNCSGDITGYPGTHPATPWQAADSDLDESGTATAPSVTAADANSMLVMWVASASSERSADPAGMTNRSAYGSFIYTDDKLVNAGATGAIDTTFPSSQHWVAQVAVLKPRPI